MKAELWITCTCGHVENGDTVLTHKMEDCLPMLSPDRIPEKAVGTDLGDRRFFHIQESKYVSSSGSMERVRMIGQIIKPVEDASIAQEIQG